TSEDGENWSSPQQVTMSDGTPLDAVFEQDPHILESGRIVNAAHFQKGLMVSPIYTDDKSGVSGWKKAEFTPTDKGETSREMEPSIFKREDGILSMIFRDQDSSYTKRVSYSRDNGESWSDVLETSVPDARTKQSAGNLSDGKAFMVGSPVDNKLRSPLAIMISNDGKYFDKAFLLRSNESDPEVVYEGKAKRKGFHYAKSYVCDGNVYVGYATNKEAVEITIIPEKSLN
ncbi:MAG: exo-alpha-sialidase, partial [Firmicutes bacterium]|nr:exo-alpha-sialidase [Bacillota bacterium]